MRRTGYDTRLSAGTYCAGGDAAGIPDRLSVMLVVMGPVMNVSVARLYAAAIVPGILLAGLYIFYTMVRVMLKPEMGPPLSDEALNVPRKLQCLARVFFQTVPVATLILLALGQIISGLATPTEGAALGSLVVVDAATGRSTFKIIKESSYRTAETTSMVMILLAASTFMGAVFSSMGTPKLIADTLLSMNLPPILVIGIPAGLFHPGGRSNGSHRGRHRPIFLPILKGLHTDMIWLAILLAVTLQTCWLSPPVALSAYYLKGVEPSWELLDIYRGMMPFMALQAMGAALIYFFPEVVLWLPKLLFG